MSFMLFFLLFIHIKVPFEKVFCQHEMLPCEKYVGRHVYIYIFLYLFMMI